MKSSLTPALLGVNALTRGMSSFGIIGEDGANAMQKAAGALQMMSGAVAIMGTVSTVMEMRNKVALAQATALTSTNVAAGPIGWGKIAVASASAGAAYVAVLGITTMIKADTETTVGRGIIQSAIGGF